MEGDGVMISRIMGWVGVMSACIIFLLSLFMVEMFDMSPIVLGLSGVLLALVIVLFAVEEGLFKRWLKK